MKVELLNDGPVTIIMILRTKFNLTLKNITKRKSILVKKSCF